MEPSIHNIAALEPGLLRVPGWEHLPWLRAGFSTRRGGRSQAYGPDEQNLGWTAGDDPDVVARNRRAFAQALTGQAAPLLHTVRQVHRAEVQVLDDATGPWMSAEGKACVEGDGLVAGRPGALLAVLTADCVPVLVADVRTHAVGAFHAGWRGTLAGIATAGVRTLEERFGSQPGDLIAAIGPCIRACCFEVGEEVRDAFLAGNAEAASLFLRTEKAALHMDLQEANRRQLLAAGLSAAHITTLAHCTVCARSADGRREFFSYRAEAGNTGRMLSGIMALA